MFWSFAAQKATEFNCHKKRKKTQKDAKTTSVFLSVKSVLSVVKGLLHYEASSLVVLFHPPLESAELMGAILRLGMVRWEHFNFECVSYFDIRI